MAQRTTRPHDDAHANEGNLLLRGLPRASYLRCLPQLESLRLEAHTVLWEPGAPIDWVYFPRTLVASLLVPVERELPVEAATVGREGLVGVSIVLGADSTSVRAIVQVDGDTARMSSAALRRVLADDDALLKRTLLYAHALQQQTAQSVACNARHALEERCARWLLTTHDRVDRDEFTLLQVFLASMLGVHRPRVTVAAGMLQRAGLISYHRGKITIVDRAGLEAASCECYEITARTFSELRPRQPI